MSKKEVKYKGVVEKQALISMLEEMVSALKQGTLTIEGQEEAVCLKPGQNIKAEFKVKSGKEKQELEIELGWRLDQEIELKPLDMIISSREIDNDLEEGVSENPDPGDQPRAPAASGPTIAVDDEKK